MTKEEILIKREAIAFSEWMCKKIEIGFIGWTSLDPGKLWMVHGEKDKPIKTTQQLYQLYKQQS